MVSTVDKFKDAFKAVKKLNSDSAFLSDSTLSQVDSWISTGCYALNAIISGSVYGGIPMGRITGFAGPSQCGKTLIMNKIFAEAQKKDMIPVIWDTEAAEDANTAAACGCDPSKIRYNPVESVEDCRNQIVTFLDKVIETPELRGKCIIGIDSLGNLASSKELADAVKGKSASDMGLRAKAVKSLLRCLTYRAAKANVPIVFSNHTYEDPSLLFGSIVKNQSGGSAPLYLSSVLVQMAIQREQIKDNKHKDAIEIAHKVSGLALPMMTVKNRFVPAYLKTAMYINFKSGLEKYSGLLEIAVAYNIIKQTGATFELANGEKLGYAKSFENDSKFWEKILPDLNDILQKELSYSNESIDNAPDTEECDTEE